MSAAPRNSLQAALNRQAAPEPEPEKPAAPERPEGEPKAPKFSRPSRVGTKFIGGHFPPNVAKQLKMLAAEEETTTQALLEEAIDLLFVKKGRGRIIRV